MFVNKMAKNTETDGLDLSGLITTELTEVTVYSLSVLTNNKQYDCSKYIRRLLIQILAKQGIDDELDDGSFPYRLKQSKLLVSFSHSVKKVEERFEARLVMAISNHYNLPEVGIDCELKNISANVAQRFFASNELAVITNMSANRQAQLMSMLWMAKEAYIKVTHNQLITGLATDMLSMIDVNVLLAVIEADGHHQSGQRSVNLTKNNKTKLTVKPLQFYWLPSHQSVLCLKLFDFC